MARKRTPLTHNDFPKHVEYLADKVREGTFKKLLRSDVDTEAATLAFQKLASHLDLEDWEDRYLSSDGRKRLIAAISNRKYYHSNDLTRIAVTRKVLTSLDNLVKEEKEQFDPDMSKSDRRAVILERALDNLESLKVG